MPIHGPLPRRALLGARLPPDEEAFSAQGMRVASVVPGGMAHCAGLQGGDTLVAIDAKQLVCLGTLGDALRWASTQDEVTMVFERSGERRHVLVRVQRAPEESISGQTVSYECISRGGARLRTIVTQPRDAPPRGAVLCVPGIACESTEGGPGPMAAITTLVQGWAAAGYVTMRMDKRGTGDSEGGPCGGVDFRTELDDFRAAMRAFCDDARTQHVPLFVFGHSVGGMMVPLLHPTRTLHGIMVSGTSTMAWMDCVVSSTRRQLALRGTPRAEVDARVTGLRDRVARDGLNGRTADYHHQLATVDLEAAWAASEVQRLLVLRGEHDWVVDAGEQQVLATLVDSRRHSDVTLVDIPGVDHLLGWHPNRDASLSNYGAGSWDPQVLYASLEWMGRVAVDSTP